MTVVFDLDDTLFPEMDFVRSAYKAIADRYGKHLLDAMLSASSPREAFDSTGLPIAELLKVYRNHFPDIRLPWQSLYTLALLKNSGCSIALVTDGRSVTQRNKIRALGLDRFIGDENIFISEEVGSEKISGEAFRRIMNRDASENNFMYVGDNPKKDFIEPNRLGWTTVCLLSTAYGENISEQNFKDENPESLPDLKIGSILELIDLVMMKSY